MSVMTTPHLNFRGDAAKALEFYQSVFGGDLVLVTNEDAHSVENPEEAKQIKFGQVTGANGFRIMAYDVPSGTSYDPGEKPVFISVRSDSEDEITELWNRLSAGSTIVEDLGPSGFAPLYGMLKDPFGVLWVLDVAVPWDAS